MTKTPVDAIIHFVKYILYLFDEYSKPNSKYVKDKRELRAIHKRVKAVLFNQLALLIVFLINIFTANGQFENNLQGVCSTTLVSIATFICNRFHPEYFRGFVNFVNIVFGILLANRDDEGLHGAWVCASNFPMIIYVATGSLWHFAVNMSIQVFCVNYAFQAPMKRSLTFIEPESFVKNLTYQTNQTMFYSIAFTLFTHTLMQEAFREANYEEKKKEDFQNQKNFLLSFSHELRNLINSLIGSVKLASLEAVSEKARDLLMNAEFSAEMLLQLINNILDTGKVELGDLEINTSPIRIYDLIERVWSICSELIRTKNLRGKLMIQKNIPQILTLDHYRLTQILLNLVGNAVKYTDIGEIDVSVEWLPNQESLTEKCFEPYPFNEENEQDEGIFEKKRSLSVFDSALLCLNFVRKRVDRALLNPITDERKGILKITVRDTGVGIPRDGFNKLFQKFMQVTSDPSKKKLGTGLGLYITKELCNRMDGDIRVFSKLGSGSAFCVCLPVQPEKRENDLLLDRDLIRRLALQKNLKAMIVDDEQFNHIILREYLNKLGVEVVELAENGLIAYNKYESRIKTKNRPDFIDIVTMDLNMPVMDGKTSAQKIREIELRYNLGPCLLIIVSANCIESEISYCTNKDGSIRANAFLKKPATLDEMSRIISAYLSKIYRYDEIKLITGN